MTTREAGGVNAAEIRQLVDGWLKAVRAPSGNGGDEGNGPEGPSCRLPSAPVAPEAWRIV
jgi:hypothetical protein